jgi:hypothetical protein
VVVGVVVVVVGVVVVVVGVVVVVVGVVVEVVGVVVVVVWQVPLEQSIPLQHCAGLVQFFPSRLQPGGSAAASPMPSDASVPPTRAAPINLSALPRERVPLESPTASSSKELAPFRSLAIGYPFPQRAGLGD